MTNPTNNRSGRKAGKHVVVAGCGNIGSFLVLLLVRMAGIAKLTLVDFDCYEESNLGSQHIIRSDVGKPKASVLARLARRLNPRLAVIPIVGRLESVPPGRLRGDVILACLDSKEARRSANEVAWRLGMPLVDAGVEASAMLARVSVYQPTASQPCMECAWDERDYAQLAVMHPCEAAGPSTPSTGAPACLGALAASLQAIEGRKILGGDISGAGRQVLIEAATHKHFVTTFRRNLNCRFNHEIWDLSKLQAVPSSLSVSDALKLTGPGRARLAFAGMQVARQLACPGCGFTRRILRLESRVAPRVKTCPRCGRELLVPGFHSLMGLDASEMDRSICGRSLASLGFREGDIITVGGGENKKIFELGPARTARNARRRSFKRRSS